MTRNLGKHEQCEFHKQAVVVLSKTKDISEMLSTKVAADKEKPNLFYEGSFYHALRGDDEIESNFIQLMLLRGEDCGGIGEFLEKRQLKYTSHEVQNEILSIMSQSILRDIVKNR